MKAYINYAYQVAYVLTDDVGKACSVGVWFAHDNPDLLEAHWTVCCYRPGEITSRTDRQEVEVDGAGSLAKAIRRGPDCPHVCPQHPKAD